MGAASSGICCCVGCELPSATAATPEFWGGGAEPCRRACGEASAPPGPAEAGPRHLARTHTSPPGAVHFRPLSAIVMRPFDENESTSHAQVVCGKVESKAAGVPHRLH